MRCDGGVAEEVRGEGGAQAEGLAAHLAPEGAAGRGAAAVPEEMVVNILGDPSGQRLYFVDFGLVVPMPALYLLLGQIWQSWHGMYQVSDMVELPNQSQQNIVTDLMGRPVICFAAGKNRENNVTD